MPLEVWDHGGGSCFHILPTQGSLLSAHLTGSSAASLCIITVPGADKIPTRTSTVTSLCFPLWGCIRCLVICQETRKIYSLSGQATEREDICIMYNTYKLGHYYKKFIAYEC